jgi:hypothetical protein
MAVQKNYCIGCGDKLLACDADTNGTENATCKRCRAMDEHDFDVEPNAVFNRQGERTDLRKKPKTRYVLLDNGRPASGMIIFPESALLDIAKTMENLGAHRDAAVFHEIVRKGREFLNEPA